MTFLWWVGRTTLWSSTFIHRVTNCSKRDADPIMSTVRCQCRGENKQGEVCCWCWYLSHVLSMSYVYNLNNTAVLLPSLDFMLLFCIHWAVSHTVVYVLILLSDWSWHTAIFVMYSSPLIAGECAVSTASGSTYLWSADRWGILVSSHLK